MGRWSEVRWFLVFHGLADAYLWEFEADGWRLQVGDPAMGSVGIAPAHGEAPASLSQAWWLADACAYDHDAPVGLWPAWDGEEPKDEEATSVSRPTSASSPLLTRFYWENVNTAYYATAENRFQDSYILRYDGEPTSPSTRFKERFNGREDRVSLYAMAARQFDILSEYLCLYRVIEAADQGNGKTFVENHLPRLPDHDFGELIVAPTGGSSPAISFNAFEFLREQAYTRLSQPMPNGFPNHLYKIRNSIAHGKEEPRAISHGLSFGEVAAALPIVKLLARLAVESRAEP